MYYRRIREQLASFLQGIPLFDHEELGKIVNEVHHCFIKNALTAENGELSPETRDLLYRLAFYLQSEAILRDNNAREERDRAFSVSGMILEHLAGTVGSEDRNRLPAETDLYEEAVLSYALGQLDANALVVFRKSIPLFDATPTYNLWRELLSRVLEVDFKSLKNLAERLFNERMQTVERFREEGVDAKQVVRYAALLYLFRSCVLAADLIVYGWEHRDERFREFTRVSERALDILARAGDNIFYWKTLRLIMLLDDRIERCVWNHLPPFLPTRIISSLASGFQPCLWISQTKAIETRYLDPSVKRVVINMPTSSGKSLLAMLAILKTLAIDEECVCIYVVPTLALLGQVERDLRQVLDPLGYAVGSALSSFEMSPDEESLLVVSQVILLTPEKLDLLLRHQTALLKRCKLFVFDEAHKMSIGERGLTQELVTAWLLSLPYAADFKIIYMSAIMKNADEVLVWLRGELPQECCRLITSDWRPTRQAYSVCWFDRWPYLRQKNRYDTIFSYYHGHISYAIGKDASKNVRVVPNVVTRIAAQRKSKWSQAPQPVLRERQLSLPKLGLVRGVKPTITRDYVVELAQKYRNLGTTLVFVPTREEVSAYCSALYEISTEKDSPELEELARTIEGRLGPSFPLARYVRRGIAYHHGTLPRDIRDRLESVLLRNAGAIDIVVATSTLAEGVNLPVQNVIFSSVEIWDSQLKKKRGIALADFRNIAGRAGRARYETEGHVVILEHPYPIKDECTFQEQFLAQDDELSEDQEEQLCIHTMLERIVDASENETPDELPSLRKLKQRFKAFAVAAVSSSFSSDPSAFTKNTFFARKHPEGSPRYTSFQNVLSREMQNVEDSVSDGDLQSLYAKTGFAVDETLALHARLTELWDSHWAEWLGCSFESLSDFETMQPFYELLTDTFLEEVLPEPDFKDVDHTRLTHDWVNGALISELAVRYFEGTSDETNVLVCTEYLQDVLVYKLPWLLNAVALLLKEVCKGWSDGVGLTDPGVFNSLNHFLNYLPSCVRYGVADPVALYIVSAGFADRSVAMVLAQAFPFEKTTRLPAWNTVYFWLLGLRSRDIAKLRLSATEQKELISNLRERGKRHTRVLWLGTIQTVLVSIRGESKQASTGTLQPGDPVDLQVLVSGVGKVAIAVWKTTNRLGFMPRALSTELAKAMEHGYRFTCWVADSRVTDDRRHQIILTLQPGRE